MTEERSSALVELYLAALALAQSPVISDQTRHMLKKLMITVMKEIEATASVQSDGTVTRKTLAKKEKGNERSSEGVKPMKVEAAGATEKKR